MDIVFKTQKVKELLSSDLPSTVHQLASAWNAKAPKTAQIDIQELTQLLASGALSTCPAARRRAVKGGVSSGGAGAGLASRLGKQLFCTSFAALLVMALMAAVAGGLAAAFMTVDRYALCSTYSEYLRGILAHIVAGQDTCAIYTNSANLIKTAITGSVSGVTLANFPSRYRDLRCAIGVLHKDCECAKEPAAAIPTAAIPAAQAKAPTLSPLGSNPTPMQCAARRKPACTAPCVWKNRKCMTTSQSQVNE